MCALIYALKATSCKGKSLNIPSVNLDAPNNEAVSCANCHACCCRLEVILITDTGVPARHIATDQWGGEVMKRLADGWCSALDRDTYLCTIYEQRPLICREFQAASYECLDERALHKL